MGIPYKQVTLTAANPSFNMTNPAGSIEVAGTFDGGTVTQNLTGGAIAVDTFTAAESFYTNASHLTFGITGGGGSESVTVKWYMDSNNADTTRARDLSRL
jgi:hypothetical protein